MQGVCPLKKKKLLARKMVLTHLQITTVCPFIMISSGKYSQPDMCKCSFKLYLLAEELNSTRNLVSFSKSLL